jgi:hypothetical protein
LDYAYFDNTTPSSTTKPVTLTGYQLDDYKRGLGATLQQIVDAAGSLAALVFNDAEIKPPASAGSVNSTASTDGHTNGLLVADKNGGYWISHSLPAFPYLNVRAHYTGISTPSSSLYACPAHSPFRQRPSTYPFVLPRCLFLFSMQSSNFVWSGSTIYAQHFFCLSLDAADIERAAKQVRKKRDFADCDACRKPRRHPLQISYLDPYFYPPSGVPAALASTFPTMESVLGGDRS